MKPFRMLGRSIRDAFKSVIRNFSLSLASISCITITLIIVAIALIASFNVESFTKEIERDLTIVVFLENDTTEEEIAELKNTFEDMPNVDSIEFESKQQVKEQMQQESDVFNTVLSEWDDEALSACELLTFTFDCRSIGRVVYWLSVVFVYLAQRYSLPLPAHVVPRQHHDAW